MKKNKIVVILAVVVCLISGSLGVRFALKGNEENKVNEIEKIDQDSKKETEELEDITQDIITEVKDGIFSVEDNKNNISNEENIRNDEDENELVVDDHPPVKDLSEKDQKAIDSFSLLNNEVDTMLKSDKDASFEDKAKGIFITIIDFIFYDGKINGVTFNELTDAGKQNVLKLASVIDEKLEGVFPGYKESITTTTKNAFNKASEIIRNGAKDIDSFAHEKLGDEYYQEIINAKDEFIKYTKDAFSFLGSVGSNLFNKGKDYLNSWYQEFKKNN